MTEIITIVDPFHGWQAITDEAGSPIGYGTNEAEAVADLMDQLEPEGFDIVIEGPRFS
jgi:hypothetical protein